MENYETPEITVITISEDIITISFGIESPRGKGDGDWIW